ncbi:recombinase family protein [Halorubrum sp. AJ67]|uniref:recombinase family protein n=1 Tax=Halorubrum sp. AJ67 TaxID=1173487 RepID=UPI0003DD8B4E|nr:recombinase family protein [Halorubrum sp. AJ67]CDK39471.1 resolvase domain protein [Halorubrum sp. AJ67]
MNRAVRIIRQSQGSEDSISLKQQRESTRKLADDLGIDPDTNLDTIDLGNCTGFSLFHKNESEDRLDDHPRIQELIENLRSGIWDYLIAHDDTRIARDHYFHVIEHAALEGACDLEFVVDVPQDRLTFSIQRAVESRVKRKEIERAKQAVEHRVEKGYWQGAPPFGLQFDDDGQFLIKDQKEWSTIEQVFVLHEQGESYRGIAKEIEDVSKSGVGKIVRDNRELYLTRLDADHPAVSSAD